MVHARTLLLRSALALAPLCPPAAAAAQGTGAGPVPVVMLAPGGGEEPAAAGEFRSQLADLPVRFEVVAPAAWPADLERQIQVARGVASDRGAAVVVWADYATFGRVYLFVAEAEGGRLLVREAGSGDESAESRLMTLGVIVRGAVRGVLADLEARGAAPPAPGPAPPPPAEDGGRLWFGLAYNLQFFADDPLLLHGARLEVALRLAGPLRLLVAYRAHLPPRVEHDGLMIDVLLYPAEIGLAADLPLGPWRIAAGAGAVLTVVDLDITSADAALVPREDTRRVEFAVAPWLGAGRALGRVVSLFLRASTDVVVNRHRYVVDVGGRKETVAHPWRVRPSVLLGLGFSIL
jgi:hypothetical protein